MAEVRCRSLTILATAVFAFPAVAISTVAAPQTAGAASGGFQSGLTPTVTVSPQPAQQMQGFGASGAWWPNDLVNFPNAAQQQLAAMLFSRAGIDLSGYRYNIGGGGVGVTNPVRAPQSFLSPSGTYNWSADPGGRDFLTRAHQYKIPELTGFVNSAPTQWTTNSENCGGFLKNTPSALGGYARYLAKVVHHFHVANGIDLQYVSPMNEPDDTFATCGQEGMGVPADHRAPVVDAVGSSLALRAPWAHVIADESASSAQLVGEAPEWLLNDDTAKWLGAVVGHGYDYPTSAALLKVRKLGHEVHRPVWMTEVCCYNGQGFGSQYDPTMTSGLWLANSVWQDLTFAKDSAFYWWTAASSAVGCDPKTQVSCPTTVNSQGWNDGLVYYDPQYATDGNHELYTTKRFYVMGNFSRYIRPGAVRHPATGAPSGTHVLAFSRGHQWTVVLINDNSSGTKAAPVGIQLPVSATWTGSAVTSANQDLTPADHVTGSATHYVAHLPPQSVTTLTFSDN